MVNSHPTVKRCPCDYFMRQKLPKLNPAKSIAAGNEFHAGIKPRKSLARRAYVQSPARSR